MILIRKISCFIFLSALACDTGNLKIIADLPNTLKEVSGTETVQGSNLIWMLNDGGNKSKLYGLSENGKIKKEIKIKAKNNDWEDLTSDPKGNVYIGDFGNNMNKRKNLAILKVAKNDLKSDSLVLIDRISFKYPNQSKFPPKKKKMFFDAEAFFFYNDSLYLFTKSRVKDKFGKTSLFKIPAKRGQHLATYIGSYEGCTDLKCWITSADISPDGKKVALLNHKSVILFTNFKGDDFLNGTLQEYPLAHVSQKEGLCFKSNTLLYITDEKSHGGGGNLYEFDITD